MSHNKGCYLGKKVFIVHFLHHFNLHLYLALAKRTSLFLPLWPPADLTGWHQGEVKAACMGICRKVTDQVTQWVSESSSGITEKHLLPLLELRNLIRDL